jgi:hypothetical protein
VKVGEIHTKRLVYLDKLVPSNGDSCLWISVRVGWCHSNKEIGVSC